MQSRELKRMGTIIQLSVAHRYADFVLGELILQLEEYEKRFSAHDPASELMEVNKNAGVRPVRVNPSLYKLIKLGKQHSMAPDSSLNIAIGPLVKAWRIGFEDAHVPSDEEIHSLLKNTQASHIELDDEQQTVFLQRSGMFIDLGALAKGYIADLLVEDLAAMNVEAGIINLGGNVMTYGVSPNQDDGYWRVGIQHPLLPRGNHIAVLRAYDQSVVTSGVYERNFSKDDKTYHHILNPQTGYPIESEIAGLTIVSKESVDGEIWTGRLFGKSPDYIMKTLEQLEGIEGIVVTNDGKLYYSDALKPFIEDQVSKPI